MINDPDLWESRELPGALSLEIGAGDSPALVLAQGDSRVRIELAHAKAVITALVDAAADLTTLLATGGKYDD